MVVGASLRNRGFAAYWFAVGGFADVAKGYQTSPIESIDVIGSGDVFGFFDWFAGAEA